jgi:hypothetical protein
MPVRQRENNVSSRQAHAMNQESSRQARAMNQK